LPDVEVVEEESWLFGAAEPDHYDNGSEWVEAEASAAPEAERYEYPEDLASESGVTGEAEYASEYYSKYGYEYGYEYAYPEDKYGYDAATDAAEVAEAAAEDDVADDYAADD